MMKHNVFVTRMIPEAGLALLRARKDISLEVYKKSMAIPRAELLKKVKGATAILSLLTDKMDNEVMSAAGADLRVIANYAVGFDNIDLVEAKKRNLVVCNTPGVLNNAVAEHAIALMFAVTKRIAEADVYTREGKYKGWAPDLLIGSELSGKTLGIIGTGNIGKGVAERAKGLGMQVVYYDVKQNVELEKSCNAVLMPVDQLLAVADVVSVHVPLLESTKHLIDAKALKLMKKTAYLINTSRGPIVDEKALVTALKKKQIAGAGLDVYEFEPKLSPGLVALKNVVLTPHTASATVEARDQMAVLAAKAIIDVIDGKMPANTVKLA